MIQKHDLTNISELIIRNKSDKDFLDKMVYNNSLQVLAFWNELSDNEKDQLKLNIESINFEEYSGYFNSYLKHKNKKSSMCNVKHAEYIKYKELYCTKHNEKGDEIYKNNKVAFITVAGGQGSRLGISIPKGCMEVSTVKSKSLFQIFSEKILFLNNLFETSFFWYIMCSETNYKDTVDYFEKNSYFGLNKKNTIFFKQGMLPTLDRNGNLILKDKFHLFMNPDGHGGTLSSLEKNGLLDDMISNGISYLYYFQVDNPLINLYDSCFLGIHHNNNSEITTKVIEKKYPEEKMGCIANVNGKNCIVEYSDLTYEQLYEKFDDDSYKYNMGSVAIHIFNTNFLKKVSNNLPVHFANKEVSGYFVNGDHLLFCSQKSIKFEKFIFDLIPIAEKSLFVETKRDEEFSPVKNFKGADSLATCVDDQNNLYKKWLKNAGIIDNKIFKNREIFIEISPLFAPTYQFFIQNFSSHPDNILNSVFDKNGEVRDKIYIS